MNAKRFVVRPFRYWQAKSLRPILQITTITISYKVSRGSSFVWAGFWKNYSTIEFIFGLDYYKPPSKTNKGIQTNSSSWFRMLLLGDLKRAKEYITSLYFWGLYTVFLSLEALTSLLANKALNGLVQKIHFGSPVALWTIQTCQANGNRSIFCPQSKN